MKKLLTKNIALILVFLFAFSAVGCGCSHSYTTVVIKEASCGEQGTRSHACDKCGDTYTENYSVQTLTANEVYETVKKSLCEIITYNKNGQELALGSGFVYDSDGLIVTNYHVIENAYSIKVNLNGVNYTVSSIMSYDKEVDLAVLKIPASYLRAVKTCSRNHGVGKAVYAFGSSKGMSSTFSQGIITYENREMDGVKYVQHDSAISSGNSGGPLINEYGEVVGINTMTIKDSQNLNFAISVKELSHVSYYTPMTVPEFYEKECDVFTKVKNYITSEGKYDASDREYELDFGYVNTTSLSYKTGAKYNVDNNEIDFTIFIYDDGDGYMLFLTVDTVDGIYEWSYIDTSYHYMSGIVYASTFRTSSTLYYNYYDGIYSASLRTTINGLATSMLRLLLSNINIDYSEIGVVSSDLGFINF